MRMLWAKKDSTMVCECLNVVLAICAKHLVVVQTANQVPEHMHPHIRIKSTVSAELDSQQTHPDGFRSQPESCRRGAAAGEVGLHSRGVSHTEQVSCTAAQRCRQLDGWLRQGWGSL